MPSFREKIGAISQKISDFTGKLLAVSKVTQMVGNAVFNIKKAFGWTQNIPNGDGLSTVPGIITTVIGLPGAVGDAVVTRYYDMRRQPKIIPEKNLNNLPWYKRRINTIFQGATYIYWGYTAGGGFLSSISLSQLIAYICQSICNQFSDNCSEKLDDAWWKDFLVFGSAIILMFSAFASYKKYNLMKMRNEYIPNFLTGEWKKYPGWVYGVSGVNVGVGLALTKLQNDHTADLFSQAILERISSQLKVTPFGRNLFTGVGVSATFFSSVLMTVPAVAKLADRKEIGNYSKKLPIWWKMRVPIYVCIGLNSVLYGLGGAASIALALYSFFGINPRNLVVVIGSGVGGVISGFITVALDVESHKNEVTTRLKLLEQVEEREKNVHAVLNETLNETFLPEIRNIILEYDDPNDMPSNCPEHRIDISHCPEHKIDIRTIANSDNPQKSFLKNSAKKKFKLSLNDESNEPLLSPTRTASTLFYNAQDAQTPRSTERMLKTSDAFIVYDPPDLPDTPEKMEKLFEEILVQQPEPHDHTTHHTALLRSGR